MTNKATSTNRSARKRAKVISRSDAGNIIRLPDGRFRIDTRGPGKRQRNLYATKDEAIAALEQISKQKAAGVIATAATATFNDALDLLLDYNNNRRFEPASKRRTESVVRGLKPRFGTRKLSEFVTEHMRFIQEYLQERAEHGIKPATLAHELSTIKMAFDRAIVAKPSLIAPPNPVTAFSVRIPYIDDDADEGRDAIRLEEITTLVRTSRQRLDSEHETTFRVRAMLVLLGLLAGLRNQECAGLYWDCVDFDGRVFYVRRVWRSGKGIVKSTKTGKRGFRSIPMSPLLFEALTNHEARMKELGLYQSDGPVLRTQQAPLVPSGEITGHHWPAIANKAGFVDQTGGRKYSFYSLRHSALNLWRAMNILPDQLQRLAGHFRYDTTADNYLHETPDYVPLAREAEPLFSALGLDRTSEGIINALGLVLHRRWQEAGIDIACAAPRTPALQIARAGQLALPSNTITIDAVATASTDALAPTMPAIRNTDDWARFLMAECKRLYNAGRPVAEIATELRIGTPTVNKYLSIADVEKLKRRKLPHEDRQALMEQIGKMYKANPKAVAIEVANALNIDPKRVTTYARRLGIRVARQGHGGGHKLRKYEAQLKQMADQGLTCRQMAAALKRGSNEKTPSHSGIADFLKRIGVKLKRRGGGLRVENYDADIRKLVDAGRSKQEIVRELGGPSRSGIIGYINRLGLRPQPGNRGKRIARNAESGNINNTVAAAVAQTSGTGRPAPR